MSRLITILVAASLGVLAILYWSRLGRQQDDALRPAAGPPPLEQGNQGSLDREGHEADAPVKSADPDQGVRPSGETTSADPRPGLDADALAEVFAVMDPSDLRVARAQIDALYQQVLGDAIGEEWYTGEVHQVRGVPTSEGRFSFKFTELTEDGLLHSERFGSGRGEYCQQVRLQRNDYPHVYDLWSQVQGIDAALGQAAVGQVVPSISSPTINY